MSISCPSCNYVAPLQYKTGQRIAMSKSGWGISFGDFVGLMTYNGWREQAHPLIKKLLNCSIQKHGEKFILRTESDTVIPYEVAHLQIQADLAKQSELYNLAMSLWR